MRNLSKRIARCLPNGKIAVICAEELNRLIDECREEVSYMTNVCDRAKRLNNMARTCYEAGYLYSARTLYGEAVNTILEHDRRGKVSLKPMRNRELLYTAARGIDKVMQRVDSTWENRAYLSAVRYYMLGYEDYCCTVQGMDTPLPALTHLDSHHTPNTLIF